MTARIPIDGNLVADPDFGVGDAGTSWAHLRVASHERIRRDGEWTSTEPEFYTVTLFGAAAETAANDLHKGDRVTVQGRPQVETFDRRDGTHGAALKVYARSVSKTDLTETGTDHEMARDQGRGAPTADAAGVPVIHHTADTTAVVGVARGATALHKTLKDNGFRWSTGTASWNLPANLDEHARTARVGELLSTVRANGRDLTVVHQPVPATTTKRPVMTTSTGAAPAPIQETRTGRHL
ncbi:MAG TPA: single-stranded DNA-binding protein [Mycobacterium sp.]